MDERVEKGNIITRLFKGLFKFIGGIILTILILCLIVVGVSYFTTPTTFGLQDYSISGVTLDEIGLAEESFFNIAKNGIQMTMTDGVSDNKLDAPATQEDFNSIKDIFPVAEGDVVSTGGDVSASKKEPFTYESLKNSKLITEEAIELALNKNEMSAMLNLALGHDAPLSSSSNGLFSSVFIKTAYADTMSEVMDMIYIKSISVEEIDGKTYFKTVASVNVPSQYKEELAEMVPISLDGIYFTAKTRFDLKDGVLVPISDSANTLQLNTFSVATTKKLIDNLIEKAELGDGISTTYICNTTSNTITTIFNNLGYINKLDSAGIDLTTHTK